MSREVFFLCNVISCPNSEKHQVRSTVLYFVPKDLERATKWADALKGRISDAVPALTKILICSNHFKPDAFESNSKKLKNDALPSIFPSLTTQKRGYAKIVTTKVESVEHPFKKLKVAKLSSSLSSKKNKDNKIKDPDSQKSLMRDMIKEPNTDSEASVSNEINTSSFLRIDINPSSLSHPRFNIGTKISMANNEKIPLHRKLKITNKSVDMEKMPGYSALVNTNNPNPSVSEEIEADHSAGEESKFRDEDGTSESPNFRQKESETDEDYDIKKDDKIESRFFLDKPTDADVYEDSSSSKNAYYLGKIRDYQMLKQSLIDEHEKLQKQEQEVDVQLQELKDEVERKKVLLQNLPNEETEILKKCFSTAQIRLLMGQMTKGRWTLDDLAMAHTISILSNRNFYNYLRTDLKYPLPAVSNISRCYKSKYRTKDKKNIVNKD